jgi:hypothetical protein
MPLLPWTARTKDEATAHGKREGESEDRTQAFFVTAF